MIDSIVLNLWKFEIFSFGFLTWSKWLTPFSVFIKKLNFFHLGVLLFSITSTWFVSFHVMFLMVSNFYCSLKRVLLNLLLKILPLMLPTLITLIISQRYVSWDDLFVLSEHPIRSLTIFSLLNLVPSKR